MSGSTPAATPQEPVKDEWGTYVPAPDVTPFVIKQGEYPVAAGAWGDIFRGILQDGSTFRRFLGRVDHSKQGKKVAIKVIRPIMANSPDFDKLARRLNREISLWQRLSHENIQPFIGISSSFGPLPSAISVWQSNGTIKNYLEEHPDANRWELCRGVARGLAYLHNHDPQITHGDMKAENVLVNDWGGPCITDFGISAVHDEASIWATATTSTSGTLRYMSPELLDGSCKKITPKSDVYAYGMTCLEICTSELPFSNYRLHEQVMVAVVSREERPTRPTDNEEITDDIWQLWEDCWHRNPDIRPDMNSVEKSMTKLCSAEKPLRLLSIDHGGVRIFSSLFCLSRLMETFGPHAKPCEYFDMIAGSGTGGLLAIMLGRLRMSVQDCLFHLSQILPKLYDVPQDVQIKKLDKNKGRFDTGTFDDDKWKYILKPVINELIPTKDLRNLLDPGHRACKTFVVANEEQNEKDVLRLRSYNTRDHPAFSHRIYVAAGATLCTPQNFTYSMAENASVRTWANHLYTTMNPAEELLAEAKAVFGEHRRVSCVVSCGNGLHSKAFAPDSSLATGLPQKIIDHLLQTAVAIDTVHLKVAETCEAGTYYRFDPPVEEVGVGIDADLWKDAVAWEKTMKGMEFGKITEKYMSGELVSLQAKECATRLQRPLRSGSSMSSLDSLSQLNLTDPTLARTNSIASSIS